VILLLEKLLLKFCLFLSAHLLVWDANFGLSLNIPLLFIRLNQLRLAIVEIRGMNANVLLAFYLYVMNLYLWMSLIFTTHTSYLKMGWWNCFHLDAAACLLH